MNQNDNALGFSVLMSIYDKEFPDFLDQSFCSIAQQTLLPDEIVCVFDGPLKRELEAVVLKWMTHLNIKIIKLPSNVGLGLALNNGLSHCSYDIVARMDSDDVCDPERFSKQIQLFYNDDALVLLGSSINEFDSDVNKIIGKRVVPQNTQDINKYCKLKNPFNHMTVVFRKSIILQLGGYHHHLFMEDYNLWLRVIAAGHKSLNLPDCLVSARVGNGMLNRRKGIDYIRSEWQLFRLKNLLGIHTLMSGLIYFIMRALPRLFPRDLLSLIYKFNRR